VFEVSRLARQSAWVAALGLLSSLVGLAFDLLTVQRLGLSVVTDAALVGNTIPLLIGSIMVAAFQPAIIAALPQWTSRQAWRQAARLTIGSAALAGVIALNAPLIVRALAGGGSEAALTLMALATVILSGTIPVLVAGEYCRALLQGRERFSPSLISLLYANLAGLLALLAGSATFETLLLARWLRAVTMVGLAAWWVMRNRASSGTQRASVAAPARFGVEVGAASAAYLSLQAGVLLPRLLASFLPAGSLSAVEYGWRLLSHVTQWVILAPVMVALPSLAREVDPAAYRATLRALWRTVIGVGLAVTVPLLVGAVIACWAADRGGLSSDAARDVRLLAEAIGGLALGQISVGLVRVGHNVCLVRHQPGRVYGMVAATLAGAVVGLPLGAFAVGALGLTVFWVTLCSLTSVTAGAVLGVWYGRHESAKL
jgi:putative peptidoglycan lipid II flippase